MKEYKLASYKDIALINNNRKQILRWRHRKIKDLTVIMEMKYLIEKVQSSKDVSFSLARREIVAVLEKLNDPCENKESLKCVCGK